MEKELGFDEKKSENKIEFHNSQNKVRNLFLFSVQRFNQTEVQLMLSSANKFVCCGLFINFMNTLL